MTGNITRVPMVSGDLQMLGENDLLFSKFEK